MKGQVIRLSGLAFCVSLRSPLDEYNALGERQGLHGYILDNHSTIVICCCFILAILSLVILLLIARKRRKEESNRAMIEKKKNEVLFEALQAARQAANSKGIFLSRVSHEMRTPLNAVIGYLTLIEDGEDMDLEQAREYILKSKSASKQLLSVINGVLEASALESGRAELVKEPFDLGKFLVDIGNVFFVQAKQKNINFEIIPVGITEEKLLGDAKRLGHIISNLLSNAIKFTKDGDVTLVVTQLSQSNENVFLRFEVEDTGIGMDEDFLDRIWIPFEQESTDIGRDYGGTGLGLSIVHMLTIMMNGTIRVSSQKGIGTVINVDIPFALDILETGERTNKFDDIRAIIIGDELFSRKHICSLLEKCGVKCSFAVSANEALEKIGTAKKDAVPYSLCIIDDKKHGSIDILRTLRKEYGDELSIVMVMPYESINAEKKSREAGATAFISKPLFYSSVYDLLFELYRENSSETDKKDLMTTSYDFSGYKVLVAEDNHMNMEIVRKILEKTGMFVDGAENGRIAVDIFSEREPDYYNAILMDIQMPEMNGYEAMAAIRAMGREDAERIPIIALTANAFADDVTASISAGMSAHISKPIDYKLLFSTLKSLFTTTEKEC